MNPHPRMRRTPPAAAFVLACVVAAAAATALAGVDLVVVPQAAAVAPGEVFDVELVVTPAGSAFNGYDAVIGFDPAALTFLPQPRSVQEGPLMTDACSNTFHSFAVGPGGDTLVLSHVLLCAGVSVTGPGTVYRLRFQAGAEPGLTDIRLLAGTAFYLAGLYVNPVAVHDAQVRIGGESAVPPGPAADPRLSAAPNPFNPATVLSFTAPAPGRARLAVYTLRGELVVVLLDDVVAAGPVTVPWNGRDAAGRAVGAGVYLVRLELDGAPAVRAVTLLK